MLLRDYAATWAASRVHRPATATRIEGDLRVHILPRLGRRPLAQLRHTEVQAFVKACAERLAPGTVENVYRTLAAICHSAVRDRAIAVSPCEGVVLPQRPRAEVIPPTVQEVGILLAAMPDRYRITGVLGAGAGLRQGEALGLTVDRVNFLKRELRVDRQMVTPAHGEPALGPVKSNASLRTIPLADAVLEALASHLTVFPPGPDGLVVTYDDGRPVRRNRFGAMWRQTIVRSGLGQHRYHDLRHHFASALIAGGCSVKVVQKALGHASVKETLDVYSHLWPDGDDLTRQAVDAAFGLARTDAALVQGLASRD